VRHRRRCGRGQPSQALVAAVTNPPDHSDGISTPIAHMDQGETQQ
jgi:hypothetical protein